MPILCGTYYPSENENRVAPSRIEPAPSADIPSFHITWRDGAYYVSIPRYDGGEVVRKEDAIALLQSAGKERDDARVLIGEIKRQVDGACRAVDTNTGEDKTLEHVQHIVTSMVAGNYAIPDMAALGGRIKSAESLLAEVSETLLGTRDGSHDQIRAALLAYRNAEETAYYDALERKEMEEPRAGNG